MKARLLQFAVLDRASKQPNKRTLVGAEGGAFATACIFPMACGSFECTPELRAAN